jgi:hypothetical protein
MKRTMYIWLAAAVAAAMLGVEANGQSESLGAVARAVRKENHPIATKKFDNDNLPRTDKLSVVGPAPDESASTNGDSQPQADSAASQDSTAASGPPPAITPGQSTEERDKAYDQWKGQLGEQKSKIDLLSRELDVEQREYRLRAAAFYADAGDRLRNAGAWDKEDAQYKKQLAEKQKSLDAARKSLEDMQEQARKAGVPASVRQ